MKKIIFLLILGLACKLTIAQNLELSITSFPNLIYSSHIGEQTFFKPNLNGGALTVNYHTQIKELPFRNIFGIELSTVDWGNQLVSRLGISKLLRNQQFAVEALLLNGIALYVNQPAYVFGLEGNFVYFINIKEKKRFKVSAGLRYTQNPSYKKVGLHRFVDVPLSISWLIK